MIPVVSFGQSNVNTTVNNSTSISAKSTSEFISDGDGISYLGNSQYKIQQTAKTDVGSFAKQRNRARKKIESYATGQSLSYKILNEEKASFAVKGTIGIARCITTFQLIDKNGNVTTDDLASEQDKEASRKKLLDLKKLMDEGIITQEEYDKAASFNNLILEPNFKYLVSC